MRKTIKSSDAELVPEKPSWLDLSAIARVEVTSEHSQYPIESTFAEGDQRGWRAAERGQWPKCVGLVLRPLQGELLSAFPVQFYKRSQIRRILCGSSQKSLIVCFLPAAVEFHPQRVDEPDRRLPSTTQWRLDASTRH
jgi:hypothetical protein